MKRKMKISTIILIIVCVIGLSLLLYPTVSDFYNSHYTTRAISSYVEEIDNLSDDDFRGIWEDAIDYNRALLDRENPLTLPEELEERYWSTLTLEGTHGVMGYIEIPKINVMLPVYHGTSDSVLASSIGHVTWSSLPTGGEGTHCVVSGHRGLPTAKLFTDLDKLREGDTFTLTVLGTVLTYQVDQIRIVEPNVTADLMIEEGKDYVSLVTCTPYGINTHRLLVRGHRIETVTYVQVIAEAVVIDPLIVAPVVAFPFLFVLLMMVLLKTPESEKKRRREKKLARQEAKAKKNAEAQK